MKRVVIGILLLCGSPALAQSGRTGLGVILGEPTGISLKHWLSATTAWDAGVAWSFRRRGSFHLHADHLWHFPDAFRSSERVFPYAGVGGRFAAGRGNGILGIRIVGGIVWMPRNVPIDLFLELAPIIDLVPATDMSANGGIGARFYF